MIAMDTNTNHTASTSYPSAYQFWKLMCKLTKLNNQELKHKRSGKLKAVHPPQTLKQPSDIR